MGTLPLPIGGEKEEEEEEEIIFGGRLQRWENWGCNPFSHMMFLHRYPDDTNIFARTNSLYLFMACSHSESHLSRKKTNLLPTYVSAKRRKRPATCVNIAGYRYTDDYSIICGLFRVTFFRGHVHIPKIETRRSHFLSIQKNYDGSHKSFAAILCHFSIFLLTL